MHIPRLVCAPCGVEMLVEQNSVVVELASDNGHKIKVSSDVHRCPSCKIGIALTARAVLAEGWQAGYADIPAHIEAQFADSFRRKERARDTETA